MASSVGATSLHFPDAYAAPTELRVFNLPNYKHDAPTVLENQAAQSTPASLKLK